MNERIRQKLKQNDFINIVYRLLTSKEYRSYCADYGRNGRIFRFQKLGEENPGKNLYLICYGSFTYGMFALVIATLRGLEVADRFHFTPVVEWSKEIPYAVEGQSNPFLSFFQPVSDVSVESARKSTDVAFARYIDRAYGSPAKSYDFSLEEIGRLARIYKKYLKLRPELQTRIDREIQALLSSAGGKILGVHVRGADWRKTKVAGHPIALTEEEYLANAKEMMLNAGYEKIFLASDSESTIDLFRAEFGDRLILTQAIRTPAGGDALVIYDEKNDGFQLGFEVLRDAYVLAACDSLLCGLSYVSYGARIINQAQGSPYEKVVVLDKGRVINGPSANTVGRRERRSLQKDKEYFR